MNISNHREIVSNLFYNLDSDTKFLLNLDSELWYEREMLQSNKFAKNYVKVAHTTSRKVSTDDEEKIISIVKKKNLTLYPVQGNFGFAPVLIIKDSKMERDLARIDSHQIYNGRSSSKLVTYCFGKKNRAVQKERGIEFESLDSFEY